MALLTVNKIYKSFAGEPLLKNISFSIDEKDKIGLIGVNGAGKSTLIKIVLGLEEFDLNPDNGQYGEVAKKSELKIGYLSQNINLNPENTIFQELMLVFSNLIEDYEEIKKLNELVAKDLENFDVHMEKLAEISSRYEQQNGYAVEYKIKTVLIGLGIQEELWNEQIKNLSGGQKSRVALAKNLLEEPELLILDEPTNHLDLMGIDWLEKFLKEYNKAFIVISHDRYFLDNVTNRIFEIEGKTLKSYKGNFSDYVLQKEIYLSGAMKSFEKEQEKIKKMEEFVRKYKAGQKSKQARGRQKLLDRMERMENPVVTTRKIRLKFEIEVASVDRVLEVNRLSKNYNGKTIFNDIDMKLFKGDRVGIIGKNGVGKSTLLKIINGLEKQNSGEFKIGERVKIGYYDQNHQGLTSDYTILEELLYSFDLSEEEARTVAGGFLFSNDDINKRISSLSGGEKARVAFMKLILEKPNFLILDEPTNHLDIYSREILEEALEGYEGTLLVVSHDRHFLESTVNKIYEIEHFKAKMFDGDYDSYISRKKEKKERIEGKYLSYEEQKRNRNRISSLEKKYRSLEEKIEKLENEKSELEKNYEKAGEKNNIDELMELQEKIQNKDNEILFTMEEWEKVNQEIQLMEGRCEN